MLTPIDVPQGESSEDPVIKELKFSSQLSDFGLTSLCKQLENIPSTNHMTLLKLDLGRNGITSPGVKTIVNALKKAPSITSVDLTSNHFGLEGAKLLAEYLGDSKVCTTLTELNLFDTNLEDLGAVEIARSLGSNNRIQKIGMGWNHIGKPGLTAIAITLKRNTTITSIDLSFNPEVTNHFGMILEAIKENKTLTEIGLAKTGIVEEQFIQASEVFKDFRHIKADMRYNPIFETFPFEASDDTLDLVITSPQIEIQSEHPQFEKIKDFHAKGGFHSKSPFCTAIKASSPEVIDYFIRHQLDMNTKDEEGNTGLHLLAHNPDKRFFFVLKAPGIDLDAQDSKGNTPLCIAASGGHVVLVEKLVAAGADPYLANRKGKMPMDLAHKNGHNHVLDALKKLLRPSWLENTIASIKKGNEKILSLSSWYFSWNSVQDYHMYPICKALETNKSITELDLQNNFLGESGAKYLVTMLEKNSKVVRINMANNTTTRPVTPPTSEKLEKLLKRNLQFSKTKTPTPYQYNDSDHDSSDEEYGALDESSGHISSEENEE